MREVVRAVTLLGLPELVSELGGDLNTLGDEVGIDLSQLHQPQTFLCNRRVHNLVNLAAERLRRSDLGLMWGARSDPSRLGPLHVALVNAQTGRQAVEMIIRYLHVNFPTGSVYLKPVDEGGREFLGLRSLMKDPPPMVQFYERRVGSLHVLLKLVCGPNYAPDAVWFAHQRQSPAESYRRVFGIEPEFGMPETGIVVRPALLDAERPCANEQVREMAVSFLKCLAPPARDSLAAEVFRMIEILIKSSDCTADQTARALGLHTRTLQRRLNREGTAFDMVKDEVRRGLAERMLSDDSIPITQVAFDLHYTNTSSFTRSCRRWFGDPPRIIRRRLVQKSSVMLQPALASYQHERRKIS